METIGKSLGSTSFFKRMAEVKAWEVENPELAAAWNAAFKEDHEREEEKKRAEFRAERQRYVRQTAPGRLINMGAPPRAVEVWDKGELQKTPAVLAVERMLDEGKTFCLLTGGAGVGKTCAAVAAMACRLLDDVREDMPALFVRAVECARLGLYDAEDKALTRQMLTAGLLVIDDLGAEFLSDGSIWRSILDEVIDARYGRRAPTVLTTNLDAAAFRQRYGERISDRIRHAGVIEACGKVSLRAKGEG